jgi:LmbE family N-acetylglucosaminyl deacetylase
MAIVPHKPYLIGDTMNIHSCPSMRFLLLLVLGLLASSTADGHPLSDSEMAAIHQSCLNVDRPAVAMIVALQPGYEDLALMAYLRTQVGARVTATFLTNGEATPGDTLARFPVWMTGERKEESDRVAREVGGDAYFINLPDVPASGSAIELLSIWNSMDAARKLTAAIRTVKPDVIILCSDKRGPGATHRDTTALRLVDVAIQNAATTGDTSVSKNLYPWNVARVIVQVTGTRTPRVFETKAPGEGLPARLMAKKAAALYRTLHLQMPLWLDAGVEYREVAGVRVKTAPVSPERILRGLPVVSERLKIINDVVHQAITTDKSGRKSATLAGTSRAIDITEHVLATRRGSLPALDQRLLATWKNGLEDLRSAVLGITVTAVQSESLLTESQVWFLTLHPPSPRQQKGTTEVIFPLAGKGEWAINESLDYHFPLDSVSKFTVLTPEQMQYTTPAAEYGLVQSTLSMSFPFVVVHKDAQRERNFMYRSSVRLRIGPRRSFALRTPVVSNDARAAVIYELQNFSRNTFRGIVSLSDTSGHASTGKVEFTKKDQALVDTLYLPEPIDTSKAYKLLTLELSGKGGRRSVTARTIRSGIDSTRRVALISSIDGSPLEEALRVLGHSYERVPVGTLTSGLEKYTTVILDRDVLRDTSLSATRTGALTRWVKDGGEAIVFPQHEHGSSWLSSLGIDFAQLDPLSPSTPVESNGLADLNPLTPSDWQEWVETRAFAELRMKNGNQWNVTASCGKHALIATTLAGRGRITAVAADLQSQLMNCHPGAHRILANLIARRP